MNTVSSMVARIDKKDSSMIISPLHSLHLILFISLIGVTGCKNNALDEMPNILFCISDDQSWIHTSSLSDNVLKTPAFDRIAKEGVLFINSYVAAPSCAPSRAAILTGQDIYRLEEGGLLWGALSEKFAAFPDILKKNGYHVGFTKKGYGPANMELEGYWGNEILGEVYNIEDNNVPEGITNVDYAKSFELFLNNRNKKDQHFFFWYGSFEPHRIYGDSIWKMAGINPDQIKVPGFLPNTREVKADIANYFYEIQWFDKHLENMLKRLESNGELDNTIVIVTSDNGMPFPHAKATLYEYGAHVPLAIRWGKKAKPGRKINDFIKNIDIAPTILEALNLQIPESMNGKSFLDILLSEKEGMISADRNMVVTAIERHNYSREGGLPYPVRAIRKDNWVFLLNFERDRWPAGNPKFKSPFEGFYGDIDNSPTNEFFLENKENPEYQVLFELAFSKRPNKELYNLEKDPFQVNNLAGDKKYEKVLYELHEELINYLRETGDPRILDESPWDDYPFNWDTNINERHCQFTREIQLEMELCISI